MSDDAQIVDYAMPQTVAKIEGTVSVSTAVTGEKVPVRTSEVSLATEADRDFSTQVDVSGNEWGKRQFDLKFAPDGRLTGATQSSTGLGAEVVATGLRVAALVGKVAAGMLFAIPQQVQQPEPIREILEEEQPELARR